MSENAPITRSKKTPNAVRLRRGQRKTHMEGEPEEKTRGRRKEGRIHKPISDSVSVLWRTWETLTLHALHVRRALKGEGEETLRGEKGLKLKP